VRISQGEGGLPDEAHFHAVWLGAGLAALGDLDGDGVVDLALGAPLDDDGGGSQISNVGAVWILFMNADGTVKSVSKISALSGNFGGDLDNSDNFGFALSPAGDVNRDGIMDLAVGAPGDWNLWGFPVPGGAVWILHLRALGSVQGWTKLSPLDGNFQTDVFENNEHTPLMGRNVGLGGDWDGDGRPELLVGGAGIFGLPLDAGGDISFSGPWPAGIPDETTFWLHAWMADPAAAFGWSASNGLATTTQ
jgi:hypothetical protein